MRLVRIVSSHFLPPAINSLRSSFQKVLISWHILHCQAPPFLSPCVNFIRSHAGGEPGNEAYRPPAIIIPVMQSSTSCLASDVWPCSNNSSCKEATIAGWRHENTALYITNRAKACRIVDSATCTYRSMNNSKKTGHVQLRIEPKAF